MLSEPVPFLRDPLIQKPTGTTDKIHYPHYHIPHQKHKVSYLTSLTLISEPPNFLTQGAGTRVLRQSVPAFYDENDDDDVDDRAITTK
jgi:hypothetical protein